MSITVKRNTGWMGSGGKMSVKIDGKKVANTVYLEDLQVSLPNEEVYLTVSQQGAKSNAVKVSDGDTVEVTTRNWFRNLTITIFLLPLFIIFMSSLISRALFMVSFLVVYTFCFLCIRTYRLTIL